jgi:hypothetical protein
VTEEIPREQESGPGLLAIELGIAIPQHDWAHLAHQRIGEQGTRQQDGEEAIRPMKNFRESRFI